MSDKPKVNDTELAEIGKDQKDTLNALIKTLNESIEAVKANDKFLPQATAINETAKTIVAISRLKLDFLGIMTRVNSNLKNPKG